jgi:hypothetical protein
MKRRSAVVSRETTFHGGGLTNQASRLKQMTFLLPINPLPFGLGHT